jgi:osmotically-inducible protein OsmY
MKTAEKSFLGVVMSEALDGIALRQSGDDAEVSQEGWPSEERRGSDSRDSEIRLAIMEALHWDLAIPPHVVTVAVENGWVALSGRVHRAFTRHRADWAARGVPGVSGVTNAITLDGL